MQDKDQWLVDFPTLADLWDPWITQHCRIPDGYQRGQPFVQSDWQFWASANLGRIRAGMEWLGKPLGNQAFQYRRGQVIAPQKTGKGPWSAAMVCVQAVGPAEFDGWAKAGDVYRCADWGCSCGWVHEYLPGEPKGRRHPSPLIQLTATSEDQVETNVYRHRRSMIQQGPLRELMADRGDFVRIFGQDGGEDTDRIDVVTASARARLGNPVTFVLQDETGLWNQRNGMASVAAAQRRGLAGMGGRSLETSNAWDAAENSVAQQTFESPITDIYRFFRKPPAELDWLDLDDRRAIIEYVYKGSPWVNVDSILAEAAEVSLTDPEQAMRFFGNIITYAKGTWLPMGLWEGHYGMDTTSTT